VLRAGSDHKGLRIQEKSVQIRVTLAPARFAKQIEVQVSVAGSFRHEPISRISYKIIESPESTASHL